MLGNLRYDAICTAMRCIWNSAAAGSVFVLHQLQRELGLDVSGAVVGQMREVSLRTVL